MYAIVKDCYTWKWPSSKTHLANTQVKNDQDVKYRIQGPDEEEQDYTERMGRLAAWPQKEADGHAQWLSYALITAHALDYLQRSSAGGQSLRGVSGDHRYYFNPKKFYEYTWMCLNQGHGSRSWKQSPGLPEVQTEYLGAWCSKKALAIVGTAIDQWDTGVRLEDMYPVLTLDDMFPAPKDRELINLLKRKLEPKSAADIR